MPLALAGQALIVIKFIVTPNLQAVWICGLVAKKTDTAQSDIDVMLVGRDLLLGEVLERLMPLEAQLGRKINPNVFTPQESAQRKGEPARVG